MTLRLARIAWRNLWRNRRRTVLTLSSIAFGTTLAILFTGIGDSNWREMIDLAARLGGGHVTLQNPEYLDTPTLSRTVREADLPDAALSDPEVLRSVTRISGQLMLASAGQSYGAGFIALDPAREDVETMSLLEALSEGSFLASSDGNGIVLGRRLAENLDVTIGRKVVFTTTDRDGEIVRDVARVRGILHTGSPGVDAYLCLLPLDRMRRVLGYAPDEAIQVALFLGDQRRSGAVAERLSALGGAEVAAVPWYENQPDLASFIAMKVAGAVFMEVVIALLIAAGIFNTLFVSVMERIREFGILTALGFSPASLFALVMLESLWLGLVGLACGALVVAGPYWYMNTVGIDLSEVLGGGGGEVAGVALSTVMRADIYAENLVLIAGAALVATLLSGLYPAWKAGRVEPVESIKLV